MLNNSFEPELFSIITANNNNRDVVTRNSNKIRPIYPRTDAVKMCFSYQFAVVWNQIPEEIKLESSNRTFRNTLIAFFCCLYNNS